MMRGFAEPDLRGQRQASCPALRQAVQTHAMKARLLGGTVSDVGHFAPDPRPVRVAVLRERLSFQLLIRISIHPAGKRARAFAYDMIAVPGRDFPFYLKHDLRRRSNQHRQRANAHACG